MLFEYAPNQNQNQNQNEFMRFYRKLNRFISLRKEQLYSPLAFQLSLLH